MENLNFSDFKRFYVFYLRQHQHPICRRLHFCGAIGVIILICLTFATGNGLWALAIPVVAYSFSWVGHVFYEKNDLTSFHFPIKSIFADILLFKDMLTGRVPF